MHKPVSRRAFQRALSISEDGHGDRRRQGEPGPGGESTKIAGADEPDRKAGLAARGPRQELRERDQVGIGGLVEPAPSNDEFPSEVAEVGNRPAEAGQAELEKDEEDFEGRARPDLPETSALERSAHRASRAVILLALTLRFGGDAAVRPPPPADAAPSSAAY